MKKLLLSLGALAIIVAPIAAVVSCSSDDDGDKTVPINTNGIDGDKTTPPKVSGTEGDKTKEFTDRDAAIAELEKLAHFDEMTDNTKAEAISSIKDQTLEQINENIRQMKDALEQGGKIDENGGVTIDGGLSTETSHVSDDVILGVISVNGTKSTGKLAVAIGLPKGIKSIIIPTPERTDLDNGDTVDLTITYETGYIGKTTITYTVSGLKIGVSDTDIFGTISVSGTESKGTLSIAATLPTGVKSIILPAPARTDLSNTDTVKVLVAYETGYIGKTTITYTVSGLKEIVNEDDIINSIVLAGDDKIASVRVGMLPTGVSGITFSKSTDLSNGEIVKLNVIYDATHTGSDTIDFDVENLKLNPMAEDIKKAKIALESKITSHTELTTDQVKKIQDHIKAATTVDQVNAAETELDGYIAGVKTPEAVTTEQIKAWSQDLYTKLFLAGHTTEGSAAMGIKTLDEKNAFIAQYSDLINSL